MSNPREIRRRVDALADRFARDPAAARSCGRTMAESGAGLAVTVSEGRWQFTADASKAEGGLGVGPNPGTLMRGAIGACLAIDIRLWAARRDIPIDKVEVAVESEFDARRNLGLPSANPAGWMSCTLHVDVTSDADPQQVTEIVGIAISHNPRFFDLTNPISTVVQINA